MASDAGATVIVKKPASAIPARERIDAQGTPSVKCFDSMVISPEHESSESVPAANAIVVPEPSILGNILARGI
jgi:hypothetical protein